jgi:hypothetical protein
VGVGAGRTAGGGEGEGDRMVVLDIIRASAPSMTDDLPSYLSAPLFHALLPDRPMM